MTAAFVCIVPKPAESCWFENHGFAVFLGVFSSGMSASASSFFRFSSRALHLVRSDPRLVGPETSSSGLWPAPVPHPGDCILAGCSKGIRATADANASAVPMPAKRPANATVRLVG
jgi:hypothetical protein